MKIRFKFSEFIFLLPSLAVLSFSISVAAQSPPPPPTQPVPKTKKPSTVQSSALATGQPPAAKAPGTSVNVRGNKMHVSADRSLRDLNKNQLELFGNVYIRRPQELLTSDYARLNLKTETLVAEGNVVYFTPEHVIYGSRMEYNLTSGTGTIWNGRVESDKYQLFGDRLERTAPDAFVADDADYTTCRDCPSAWKLHGSRISLTVQGYARISHVLIKINETPLVYFPYLIIPVKTRRQSGFLFPRFKTGTLNGFQFMQPFFWAISRNMDATLAVGKYTRRGFKAEGEFRYSLGSRSSGNVNLFGINDNTFIAPYQKRWAIESVHQLELPGGFDFKLHWLDASDRDYARFFPEDISGATESGLVSDVGVSRAGRALSFWTAAKRIKRTLRSELTGFDDQTVQLAPSVGLASSDHRLLSFLPAYWGLQFYYDRFWRFGPSYDSIPIVGQASTSGPGALVPGRDPIRRANRYRFVPELYVPIKLFDSIELTPSAQYRAFIYTFDHDVAATTRRGYFVTQAELATSFERLYGDSTKHRIRPALTYSNIPLINQDAEHPFSKQLSLTGGNILTGDTGRQFDDQDIVPISGDAPQYFLPIGNSLTYKITNSFILKSRGLKESWELPPDFTYDPVFAKNQVYQYDKVFDMTMGQTVNFIEYRKQPLDRRPLSRFFALATSNWRRFQNNTELYYYPYRPGFQFSTNMSIYLERYQKRLLTFERSLQFGFSRNRVTSNANNLSYGLVWSFNDYFLVGASQNWNLLTGQLISVMGRLLYQSPSQCFQISLTIQNSIDRGIEFGPNLVVNLSGDGYSNFTDPSAVGSGSILGPVNGSSGAVGSPGR